MTETDLNKLPSFRSIPPSKRHSPGRVKNVPVRFYFERHEEHAKALSYLGVIEKKFPGQATKTIVRALLLYSEEVIEPLSRWQKDKRFKKPKGAKIALLQFKEGVGSKTKAKQVSLKLSIDRWSEHRSAFRFLQTAQKETGHANDTIIRALLYYQDLYPVRSKK